VLADPRHNFIDRPAGIQDLPETLRFFKRVQILALVFDQLNIKELKNRAGWILFFGVEDIQLERIAVEPIRNAGDAVIVEAR